MARRAIINEQGSAQHVSSDQAFNSLRCQHGFNDWHRCAEIQRVSIWIENCKQNIILIACVCDAGSGWSQDGCRSSYGNLELGDHR